MTQYNNATVEWDRTSVHGTVALRLGEVSHFAAFANTMGLIIAVCAGLMGRTVDFTTDGEKDGKWTNVQITDVN